MHIAEGEAVLGQGEEGEGGEGRLPMAKVVVRFQLLKKGLHEKAGDREMMLLNKTGRRLFEGAKVVCFPRQI